MPDSDNAAAGPVSVVSPSLWKGRAMKTPVSDVAFTPAVKAKQSQFGSRDAYRRMEEGRGWQSTVTPDLAAFVAQRDSFYLATASADGQPYIQHRGGPPGFLKVIDETTIAFPDYGGNQQYISVGNLSENDKVNLFLMDYPNRSRIKIWGRAKVVDDDPALLDQLDAPESPKRPQRAIVITLEAWDVNCPQHITPRFSEADVAMQTRALHARIADLERELESLRGE
jgi:predicted pyridoxine 5'-phosphate oxidase superfamily flavin-nucleotide-binding protein